MDLSRRQVVAGTVGGVATLWGTLSFFSRDALRVTDQYAVLSADVDPPVVDLGCIVTNETIGRCAATVHIDLDLPTGKRRTVTQEVRPFGRNSDQVYRALEFPDEPIQALANATVAFSLTDCDRLGVWPPVPVGCDHEVIRTSVEA